MCLPEFGIQLDQSPVLLDGSNEVRRKNVVRAPRRT